MTTRALYRPVVTSGDVPRTQPTAWTRLVFLPHLTAIVATLLVMMFSGGSSGLLLLALVASVHSVTHVIVVGGRYLTPSGVFFLAGGVFIGGASYYLADVDTKVSRDVIFDAAAIALLSMVAIAIAVSAISIGWRTRWPAPSSDDGHAQHIPRPPREFPVRALLLILVAFVPGFQNVAGPVVSAMGLTGIIMLVLVASSRRLRLRWTGDVIVVALAVVLPVVWALTNFGGGGRLVLAGVGIASFLGWNLVRPSRMQKVLVVLSIPVFLAFAGISRVERHGAVNETATTDVVRSGEGLASVYSPLETWARMSGTMTPEQAAHLGPRWGGTFVNTLYLPIPRLMWDDKPKGFGAELTEVFEPQMDHTPHSMASLIHGEWYANFGYGGLFLMIPVTALGIAWLDRWHARLARSRLSTIDDWWRTAMLMCVTASLAELVWAGSFMVYSRGGLAAVVTFVIWRASSWRVPHHDRPLKAAVAMSARPAIDAQERGPVS